MRTPRELQVRKADGNQDIRTELSIDLKLLFRSYSTQIRDSTLKIFMRILGKSEYKLRFVSASFLILIELKLFYINHV